MILVTNAKGGLYLRRDTDSPDAGVFVATDELAALLADLLTHATTTAALSIDAWDAYAWLYGNDEAGAPA